MTLSRGGAGPRDTAAPGPPGPSLARDRAAARAGPRPGCGREPPTSSANTVIALSRSDALAWTASAESLAAAARRGPAQRRRRAAAARGQPMSLAAGARGAVQRLPSRPPPRRPWRARRGQRRQPNQREVRAPGPGPALRARPSGVASSHGGRAMEAELGGRGSVCRAAFSWRYVLGRSAVSAGRSGLVSFLVPVGPGQAGHLRRAAGTGPSASPSSQPSCSPGRPCRRRSGVPVAERARCAPARLDRIGGRLRGTQPAGGPRPAAGPRQLPTRRAGDRGSYGARRAAASRATVSGVGPANRSSRASIRHAIRSLRRLRGRDRGRPACGAASSRPAPVAAEVTGTRRLRRRPFGVEQPAQVGRAVAT